MSHRYIDCIVFFQIFNSSYLFCDDINPPALHKKKSLLRIGFLPKVEMGENLSGWPFHDGAFKIKNLGARWAAKNQLQVRVK